MCARLSEKPDIWSTASAGRTDWRRLRSMIETNQLQQFKGAIAPLRS